MRTLVTIILFCVFACNRNVTRVRGDGSWTEELPTLTEVDSDGGYCIDYCWYTRDMSQVDAGADLSQSLDLSHPVDDDCNDWHRHDTSPGHVKHCGETGHWVQQ